MKLFTYLVLLCLVLLCAPLLTVGQNCMLPSQTEIEGAISELLQNSDASNTDPVTISSFQYTCQVQGDRQDTYRQLSIIASYTNAVVGTQTRHFQLVCQGNQWNPSLSEGLQTPPNNYQSLSTRTDCRQCIEGFGDDHCRGCNPACPGSGRCPALGQCCSYFATDGTCTENCTASDGINYISGTASTNFTCMCNLTCDSGYITNDNCTICVLNDICMADDSLCLNGGTCTLLSSPDNYTCNCTDTGYTGVNCNDTIPMTSMAPSPSPSPPPCTASNCDTCEDDDLSCCKVCESGYTLSNNGCDCVTVSVTPSIMCMHIPGCRHCMPTCCQECFDGLILTDCKCESMSSTMMISRTPTPTPTPGITDRSTGDLAGIIIGALLGVLLLLALAAVVAYLIYYFVAGPGGAALNKAKTNSPFANGESHNNPLYLPPEEVAAL